MSAPRAWRVVDTGVRRAVENLALNRAMLEARRLNEIPSTLRFLRFQPCALLGYHQAAEQELNLAYCRANGIAIQRRITGGGAIYFDEGQLGWELYLARTDTAGQDMQSVARHICEAAARGMSELGVNARFRPRTDIEVDGRKISGTGGAFDGDALMYQGTMLLKFDVERMLRVLRIPAEKLSDKAIQSARERVVDFVELIGEAPDLAVVKRHLTAAFARAFDVCFTEGELCDAELRRMAVAVAEMDRDDWVHLITRPQSDKPILGATQKFSGGLLHVALTHDRDIDRIRQAWFTGDMFVSPRRAIADLEAALVDCPAEDYPNRIRAFFQARHVDMLNLGANDFIAVVAAALSKDSMATADENR
jgi:lipoate-protein ligase A